MKRRVIELSLLAAGFLASLVCLLCALPVFRIEGVQGIDQSMMTPSVWRICREVTGSSRLLLWPGRVEKRFEDLCYVKACNVKHGVSSTLDVELELEEEGIVLTDLERCFFCTGEGVFDMDPADAYRLDRAYIPLVVDVYSFDYISRYGIENGFGSVIALLLEISSLLMYNQKLISFAVYQPGDGNGFGTLKLKMAGQDCWVDIKENTDAAYLVTLFEKLREEAVLPYSLGAMRYEIKDNVLIRREVVV